MQVHLLLPVTLVLHYLPLYPVLSLYLLHTAVPS